MGAPRAAGTKRAASAGRTSVPRRAGSVLRAGAAVGLGGYLFAVLHSEWSAALQLVPHVQWAPLLRSAAWCVAGLLLLPVPTLRVIRSSHRTFGYGQAARAYFLSQPSKYLPGGLWSFPARVVLLRGARIGLGMSSIALLWETTALVASSSMLGLLLPATLSPGPTSGVRAGMGVVLGSAVVVPLLPDLLGRRTSTPSAPAGHRGGAAAGRPRGLWERATGGVAAAGSMSRASRYRLLLESTLACAGTWLLAGLSVGSILEGFGSPRAPSPFLLAAAFSVSWLVGYLSFLTPAGLGVREAALAFLLRPWLPAPLSLVVAVLARLVWIASELTLFGLAVLGESRARPRDSSGASPKELICSG